MASRTLRRRATYRALGSHQRSRSHPLLRVVIVVLVGFTMLTSGASAGTLFFYGQNLPTLKSFKARFQFQNSLIRDQTGRVLYDMADLSKQRGRRVVEPLVDPRYPTSYYQANHQDWLVGSDGNGIPVILQDATVATEDATFWNNPGFDPLAIIRSAYENFKYGHVVSGASTITQQLVRRYMLDPTDRSLTRKTQEVILAAELTQKYAKTQILYYYLNSVSYGNLAIGAQAAAKTYFNEDVWRLDPAQAAFLAGLPEAPTLYDPVNDLPAALKRMRYVLHLMYQHGYLRDANGHPDSSLINTYMSEPVTHHWKFVPASSSKLYPHFVEYAINQLENIPQLKGRIYNGLDVWTTLDPKLQQAAQSIVKNQIAGLGSQNVTDGALVSMDLRPRYYGWIRAMVGSADYYNKAISGQINMADSPRQPGSSFKPFNYVFAFQNGVAPGTTVLDAPLAIPDTGNPEDGGMYAPTNYDHTFHGVVTLRAALANSLNVPAVRVEQYSASVGSKGLFNIRDQAIKMGITSLGTDNPGCCGWALTLGGLERGVRLVEETAAYGTFAGQGYGPYSGSGAGWTVPPIAIDRVYDRTTHKLLYDWRQDSPVKPQHVLAAPYAYEMTNVLSDNNSRCLPLVCEFGLDSPLNLGRPVAAKTGTTNSYTDNWTVGYTPDIVTGVWVGNADNSPMIDSTGITGAAPIWHDYMLAALKTLALPPKDFVQPPGVYSGSTCRQPGPLYSLSTTDFDIYAGVIPLCSVGTYDTTLPLPPQTTYQPPVAHVNPVAQQPVQPAAPAPAAPSTLEPTR